MKHFLTVIAGIVSVAFLIFAVVDFVRRRIQRGLI